MTPAPRHDPTRAGKSKAARRAILAAAAALFATLPLALDASLPSSAPRVQAIAVERASYAVGVSAGAGFRGVVQVAPDPFRQGLLDGLAGAHHSNRIMSRPELFARIRDAMKRLSDAEVAAVAARIDQGQDS